MNKVLTEYRSRLLAPLAALGVVYGDIGTSPLYAVRECFHPAHGIAATRGHVLGILSLILWSLLLIVSIKYLGFVLRANNRGEGGILALMALAVPHRADPRRGTRWLIGLGIFGAGLLYGDGVLTPSLTVLSAIEGLNVATPIFEPYIVPITIAILIGLFAIQHHGTGTVGRAFGPVMVLWFVVLGILGIKGLLLAPEVLWAINPLFGVRFLLETGGQGFAVIGAVFLVVTGAEALYADMGHFGVKPIRQAWIALVFPGLTLNYFGQGALVLTDPTAVANPFYLLAPSWAQYPLVFLATAAAIIASQALISGVYSLTMQAVQLGFLPRMAVTHTSSQQRGQIYVPMANALLLLACIALVLGFRSSSRLAAAYGIAVTLTMLITTLLFGFVARKVWRWPLWKTLSWTTLFLGLELAYCGANLLKIAHGGWVPLVLATALFAVMTTWRKGRELLRKRLQNTIVPLESLLHDLRQTKHASAAGTAVFMAGDPRGAPLALLHNLKHNAVVHERNVILTIQTSEKPHIAPEKRVEVQDLGPGFYRVIGHFGFMEQPNVPVLLDACAQHGLKFQLHRTTFFLSSETILSRRKTGLSRWRAILFAVLARNAQRATAFFSLPPNRVVELGMQVEL
ncbi:MAG TPA: potassium transporter Kup [Clostridia bacterium]|nr:potassium transporter Kup [Clostridia bacterium]